MNRWLSMAAGVGTVICLCSWLDVSSVHAQGPLPENLRGPTLAEMKQSAWEALLGANKTSLIKGREQKFLEAIHEYENYLVVSQGDEEDVFLQLAQAHIQLARLYEVKKDEVAWKGQYRQAAEVYERIASSDVFSDISRASALSSAIGLYENGGDRNKSQKCREKLKDFDGKVPKIIEIEETTHPR